MKHSIKKFGILLVIFLVVFTTACGGLTEIDFNDETQVKRVLSSDNGSSILVPKIWSDVRIEGDHVDINVESPLKEQYAVVLTESADLFSEDMTLDDYYELISESMRESMDNTTLTEPQSSEIDNSPALLFELHEEGDEVKISYLVALVKGESNYYQIVTWTLQDKFEDYKDLYMNIINSFETYEENIAKNEDNSSENVKKESNNIIVSTDGDVQLTTTEDWKQTLEPLSFDSSISIINKAEDMYILVIPDSKEYFTDDMTINDYYTFVLEDLEFSLTNTRTTDPISDVLDNYDSIQFEFFGEMDKIKFGYLTTIVETEDSYYQVIAWSVEPIFLRHKEELSDIINSFKVIK